MGTPEVHAVFHLLYAFRDGVSRVRGVRMPTRMDPQYPYTEADTEGSLSQVLMDQQTLSWRAHELWRRDAQGVGLASREAAALPQHLQQVDPYLFPVTMQDLRDCVDARLEQADQHVEELSGLLGRNRRRSIKDYW